jgi:hypothetical protein
LHKVGTVERFPYNQKLLASKGDALRAPSSATVVLRDGGALVNNPILGAMDNTDKGASLELTAIHPKNEEEYKVENPVLEFKLRAGLGLNKAEQKKFKPHVEIEEPAVAQAREARFKEFQLAVGAIPFAEEEINRVDILLLPGERVVDQIRVASISGLPASTHEHTQIDGSILVSLIQSDDPDKPNRRLAFSVTKVGTWRL